eukprot:366200-Chlamydomonas_euryale.AAC.10
MHGQPDSALGALPSILPSIQFRISIPYTGISQRICVRRYFHMQVFGGSFASGMLIQHLEKPGMHTFVCLAPRTCLCNMPQGLWDAFIASRHGKG